RETTGAGRGRGCAGAAVAELVLCGSRLAAARRARRARRRGDLRYGPDRAAGGGIRGDDDARRGQGLPRGGSRPGPPRMAGRPPRDPRPRGQSGADSRLRSDRASDRSRTRSARRRGPRGLAQPAARVAAPDRHVRLDRTGTPGYARDEGRDRRTRAGGDEARGGAGQLGARSGPGGGRHHSGTFDWIVQALPGTPETKGAIGAPELAAMKPEAVLVNFARADCVDQPALVEALTKRRIAAAVLDLTDPEPLPPEHPLWSLPNAHITMHLSGIPTPASQARPAARFLRNCAQSRAGEPLEAAVDLARGY